MTDAIDDLRATADDLAAEAEALVRDMVPKAAAQREIVTGPEDGEQESPDEA